MAQVNEQPGILLYTRIRKSPYYYASRRHGIQLYSVYNHTYHPRHYGDPVEEYWQLLNGVTLWDVGVERQIEISGPDAFDFTNLIVARDLNKCAVEQCKYVFNCLPDGGIINDPVLLRVEENRFWLSLADSDVELWARGVAYNSNYDVTIKEIDVGPVQVQGPKSKDVMVDLFGDQILEIPYYYLRPFELEGMRVLVSRTGYTAELGYEIYLYEASKNGVKLWDAVLEAGKPHDLAVIGPCHIRRIEGGILALGADMWFDTNPYEVGMGYDWMVDLEAGTDFIGKEALHRIKEEGPEAQAGGRGDRRGAARRLQRRLDAGHVPGEQGRRTDRGGHVGLLLAAAREEHRLRDGAHRARRARDRAGGRAPGGDDLGGHRREAVHRPQEGDAQAGVDRRRRRRRILTFRYQPGDRKEPVCPRSTTL